MTGHRDRIEQIAKMLLASGIATLSLLCVTAAQATEHLVELPDEMVGFGCYNKAKSTVTEHHYFWAEKEEDVDCGDDDGVRISKKGYNHPYWEGNRYLSRDFCTFDKIEIVDKPQAKDASKAYLVHVECWSGWGRDPQTGKYIVPPKLVGKPGAGNRHLDERGFWTENIELQVIDDELVITEFPEG